MNDKLKLLEYAAKRIVSDNDFMGFLLSKFIEIENSSESAVITLLNCTKENYYKLCLCKAPDTNSPNYMEKVRELSEYSNAEVFELNKIIKRVSTITNLSQGQQPLLMAARDKSKKRDKE